MRARGPSRPPRGGREARAGSRGAGGKPGLPPMLWVPGLEHCKQTIQIVHRLLLVHARVLHYGHPARGCGM